MLINFGSVEVLAKGVNWIYIPILALFLPPILFGEIVYYYAFLAVVTSAFYFGQNRVVLKFARIDSNNELVASSAIVLICCIFFSLISWFFLEVNALLVSLTAFFIVIHNLICLVKRACGNLIDFTVLRLTYVLPRLVLGVYFLFETRDIKFFFYVEVFSVITSFIIIQLIKVIKPNGHRVKTCLQLCVIPDKVFKYTAFGFPIFLQALVFTLSQNLDRLILDMYGLNAELAKYGIVIAISSSVTFVIAYLSIIYEVKIYHCTTSLEAEKNVDLFFRKCIVYCGLIFPLLFLCYLLFLYFKFGFFTFFDCSIFVFSFLCVVFMSKFHAFSYYSTYKSKNKLVFISAFLISMIIIFTLYISVSNWGLNGLLLTKILSCFIIYIISEAFFRYAKSQ